MNRIVWVLSVSLLAVTASGQYKFEKSYNENISTTYTPVVGNKFQVFDEVTHRLNIYNLDHSLWKSLFVPAYGNQQPVNAKVVNGSISDKTLFYYASYPSSKTVVYDISGKTIAVRVGGESLSINFHDSDSSLHLLAPYPTDSAWVYNARGELQHAYPDLYLRLMDEEDGRRIKYACYTETSSAILLYNRQHECVDSIEINMGYDIHFNWITDISHTVYDDSPDIEVTFSYYKKEGGDFIPYIAVINEDGTIMLNEEGYMYARVYDEDTYPKLLHIYYYNSKYYDLNDLSEPLFTSDSAIINQAYFEGRGLFHYYYNNKNKQLVISNDYFNSTRFVDLEILPFADYHAFVSGWSDLPLHNNLIQIAYIVKYPDDTYDAIVINENGDQLYSFQGIKSGYVFSNPNESRLILQHTDLLQTDVYLCESIHSSIYQGQSYFNDVKLFPNPAWDYINISGSLSAPTGIFNIKIFDTTGRLEYSFTQDINFPVSVQTLKAGIYILTLSNESGIVQLPFIKE
jgi:hypothetical protein